MLKLVIDTNIFFNLEANTGLGDTPKEIVENLIKIIRSPSNNQKVEVFISSKVSEELLTFHKDEDDFLNNLFEVVKVKAPNIDSINIAARLFLKIITEYRENHRQAIRVAEEQLVAATKGINGQNLNQKDLQIYTGPFTNKLRERYRQATRWNQIDSVADMEMILLAKELGATIVSADEGLCRWANEFGIESLPPRFLSSKLNAIN